MEKYDITGMSCAACVSRVERAVLDVPFVKSCSVSLLTNSMIVEGDADSKDIIEAVYKAGYGASLSSDKKEKNSIKDKEISILKKRLIYSLGFLIALMYVSMGYTMWNFPLPWLFEDNPIAVGLMQMALSTVLLIINRKFFINGFKGLIKGAPNMDTLVSLGSGASYVYSIICLFVISNSEHLLHSLYFESAGMILVLITVGKMLEAISKGKTTNALRELMSLQPRMATVIVDGKELEKDVSQIKKGDAFIVRAGGAIPVDATVISGQGTIDESSLTGESLPCDKKNGDKAYAGTILKSGFITCVADCSSEETVLSEIIRTVSNSASSKAPIARVADKVSGVFVPVIMAISLITIAIWLIINQDIGHALGRGISVLVISCPCALGLATPVAIMVGNGVGARRGILFKNATALENLGKVKTVVLDKTGTITMGKPAITDIIPYGMDEKQLLLYAYSLERKSEHPLSLAIVEKAKEMEITPLDVEDFCVLLGSGVSCTLDKERLVGGSYNHISQLVSVNNDEFERLSKEGKTPLYFAKNNELIGIIAVRDEIKGDSAGAISELKHMGKGVVMLTGDNENSAKAIGTQVGIDTVIANVKPNEKEKAVSWLKGDGLVAMVGDGINDAPALTSADVGIAIGQGTQIAIESAQVVLMNNNLTDVVRAIKLSRATLKNIYENLFWAFIYNIIGIPLAAGVFVTLLGWELSPMIGALAMSLSSFCVVTNALRLNLIKLDKEKKDMFNKKKVGIVLKVEGMMCPHCEARVKKAVEEIEGVEGAEPSHKKNTVTVFGTCDIEKVKAVIKEQGYTVK